MVKQRLILAVTFFVVVLLLMVVVSCGSAATPALTPSSTPVTSQTKTPTPTPNATKVTRQTVMPIPTKTPTPTQTQSASVTTPAGKTPNTSGTPPSGNSTNPGFPGGGAGPGANGTLTKINGNTLTLTTAQELMTVNVSSDTTIQKTITGTTSDLQKGEFLNIIGTQDTNGDIIATSITIQPQSQGAPSTPPAGASAIPSGTPPSGNGTNPGFPGGGPGGSAGGGAGSGTNGTLTKINGNTLTVTTMQKQVTVNISSDTVIQKTTTGTLSDLQEGESLTVIGTKDANGNISATSIIIQPQG